MSVIVSHKLNGVNPADIIVLADYDLTLAMKNHPVKTDHAPLLPDHYKGVVDVASRIGRFVIVTARGELSVLNYLGDHIDSFGRIPNLTLASNSGHLVHELDKPRPTVPTIIPIPGFTVPQMFSFAHSIHDVVKKLKGDFPDIDADCRELCGAVVYQFEGTRADNPRIKAFHERAEYLRDGFNANTGSNIAFSSKEWFKDVTRGYIDLIPAGMDKGITTPIIYNRYAQEIDGTPFVIVTGDSGPDYAMMKAIAHEVPDESRRLFISVGNGLVAYDEAFKQENGYGLLDHVLVGNGKQPVEQLHDFLATVGTERATTLDHRKAPFYGQQRLAAD